MTTTIATATLTMKEAVEHLFLTLSEMEDEGITQLKPEEVRFLISDICCIGTGTAFESLPTVLIVIFYDAKQRCDELEGDGDDNFNLSELLKLVAHIKEC